jgi:hypothetical protein
MSPTLVVAAWGALNALLAGLLAGFTAAGLDGGPGPGGALGFAIYAAASALVFVIALLVWLGRRRRAAGLRIPARPGAAALLAAGVTLIWLGLAFGTWIALLAAIPLLAAVMLEVSAHRH